MNNESRSIWKTLSVGISGGLIGCLVTLLGLRFAGFPLTSSMNSAEFRKFVSVYSALKSNYFQPQSSETLLNGAIGGMMTSLHDPFSVYFSPSSLKQFQSMLSSSYVGIGIVVKMAGSHIQVVNIIPNSPAAQAGFDAGDVIVGVNGKSVIGQSLQVATQHILGPAGSSVSVSVSRPGLQSPVILHAVREKVSAPSVYTTLLAHHVADIQITVVGVNTAQELHKALIKMRGQGATRFILDLRDNPGGYLDQALKMAGEFLPKGDVVVQTQARNQKHPVVLKSAGPGSHEPLVILMNGNTASAAEILSASLHDDRGIPLIGTHSYGKGTVQTTLSYADGSGIKYTIARWLTPTGTWIEYKGLTPTVHIVGATSGNVDVQLQAAQKTVLQEVAH